MAIVVDANLLVVMALGDKRGDAVVEKFQAWLAEEESLHSPELMRYEFASALTRAIAAKQFKAEDLAEAAGAVDALPIVLHPLGSIPKVVEVALRLSRRSAYDAAYIVLAEALSAELWTLDGPLYRNAVSLGFPVRLVVAEAGSDPPGG